MQKKYAIYETNRYLTELCYAAASTAKQSASYQSPVEEKRVEGCPKYLHASDNGFNLNSGSSYHGCYFVTLLRFSLFQNPAGMSLKVELNSKQLLYTQKVDFLVT